VTVLSTSIMSWLYPVGYTPVNSNRVVHGCMKMTRNLPDPVVRKAKRRALAEDTTLTALVYQLFSFDAMVQDPDAAVGLAEAAGFFLPIFVPSGVQLYRVARRRAGRLCADSG